MKKLSVLMLIAAFVLSAGQLFSQKLKSGDLKVLKGQTTLNLKYDYSSMQVGKFKDEQEYIENGTAERNKKKAGSGDEWAKKWESDKSARFQPVFEKNLNDKLSDIGLTGKEGANDAKYTLVVKTVFLEQGFQSGMGVSKPAYINMVLDLVETANPGTPVAVIQYDKIQSANMMGYDFDTGERVKSCFDRAGDNIGKLIVKSVGK
jgi:hypothetical protein